MNTIQQDNQFSPYASTEGLSFLQQQEDEYYQENNDSNTKKYQQADEFRPTFYNPFEIKHRRRTSRAQFKVLENTFLENPKPNAAIRRWLAQKLSMTPRGVQVWFQNRRAKEKAANAKKSPSSQLKKKTGSPSSCATSPSNSPSPISSSMMMSILPTQPENDLYNMASAEPLVKNDSQYSLDDTLLMRRSSTAASSPIHSTCACTDCSSNVFATPMTRTLSYPPFYSDASSSAADEEELLMTPVTPFVDSQQQSMYDPTFPLFMNRKAMPMQQQQQQDWMQLSPAWQLTEELGYFNTPMAATHTIATIAAAEAMRPVHDNTMFDNRRYSVPTNATQIQSNEFFRRLSEPMFDPTFTQFDLLPRNSFESM